MEGCGVVYSYLATFGPTYLQRFAAPLHRRLLPWKEHSCPARRLAVVAHPVTLVRMQRGAPTSPASSDFQVGDRLVRPSLNRIEGPAGPVQVEPKVMEVLVHLAGRGGEVVSKEELVQAVWEGRFVSDDVVWRSIRELRRALGDDARSATRIETIPKRGYRLVETPPTARPPGVQTPGYQEKVVPEGTTPPARPLQGSMVRDSQGFEPWRAGAPSSPAASSESPWSWASGSSRRSSSWASAGWRPRLRSPTLRKARSASASLSCRSPT